MVHLIYILVLYPDLSIRPQSPTQCLDLQIPLRSLLSVFNLLIVIGNAQVSIARHERAVEALILDGKLNLLYV